VETGTVVVMSTDARTIAFSARSLGWGPSGARRRTWDAALLIAALGQARPAASALELVGIDRVTGARRILRNLPEGRARGCLAPVA